MSDPMTPMTDGPECDCPPRAGGACHMHAADYYRAEADRLRAELARRDTTIAAVRELADDLPDLLQAYAWATPGGTWLGYAEFVADKLRAALSAPVEAGTTDWSVVPLEIVTLRLMAQQWRSSHLRDAGEQLDVFLDQFDEAPVEAGTPAEPTATLAVLDAIRDGEPLDEVASDFDLPPEFVRSIAWRLGRCWMKTGSITGDQYCGTHGREAGWPCAMGEAGTPAAEPAPDPHDGDDCAKAESERESFRDEINDVLMWLARSGHAVNARRPLLESVLPALARASAPTEPADDTTQEADHG